MESQTADVTWTADAVPVSTRFDDPYFNLENGLAETRHVFLAGNGLPERFCDGFQIAELGFGTGLNFMATLQAWRSAGRKGRMRFTSFEAYPLSTDQIGTALQPFAATGLACSEVLAQYDPGGGVFGFEDGVELHVIVGDARQTVPFWKGAADAWFLDGFSPAKNPELWDEELLQQVALHTRAGGSFATYTAAGFVRRNLAAAGFEVSRIAGYGRKRHMTRGSLPI